MWGVRGNQFRLEISASIRLRNFRNVLGRAFRYDAPADDNRYTVREVLTAADVGVGVNFSDYDPPAGICK